MMLYAAYIDIAAPAAVKSKNNRSKRVRFLIYLGFWIRSVKRNEESFFDGQNNSNSFQTIDVLLKRS